MLERIQRKAPKMIPELRDLSYEECLIECGLTTLETRRLRRDKIEMFKILNGYKNIDRNIFFSLKKDSRTRKHEVTLVKDQCRMDIRKYSFSHKQMKQIIYSLCFSISQWLPCPLAIRASALDGNLVQSCYNVFFNTDLPHDMDYPYPIRILVIFFSNTAVLHFDTDFN